MRIARLQVNHITNPLGFDLGERPTFSWVVRDARGTRSTEARIVVRRIDPCATSSQTNPYEQTNPDEQTSASAAAGELVLDTGWDILDAKACALDVPLAPRTRYAWTVSVRSDAGEQATSEPAWFETGKMDEPWQASWITCDASEPRHPVFVRPLDLVTDKPIASARLYACGLGLYQAFIGGVRVSEERLAPGTHAYDKWLQYQTYDVTELVAGAPADVELEFLLGNGWYKGRFGFVYSERGFYGDDWRLIAELCVTYADGSEQVVVTDHDWAVFRSPISFSNIYDGEHRDDTLEPLMPVQAQLLDAEVAAAETAKLHDRLSLPVVAHEEFVPRVLRTSAGECVLDLGQNIAGTFRLRVDEPAGTRVHLQFGELLQDG